jgi:hypothetical protein
MGIAFAVSDVGPVAVLCNVLYGNLKTVVNDSPSTEAVSINESGDSVVIAEIIVVVVIPASMVKNDVRSLVAISIVVVTVVSERAACEVVLVAVNSKYNACITGVSVELCAKLVYIVCSAVIAYSVAAT